MAKSLVKGMGRHTGKIASWAFLIGVIIAVLVGLVGGLLTATTNTTLAVILVVIGLVVGLLNVSESESTPFLMSGAVLIIASSLGATAMQTIGWVAGILNALLLIFVPATIIVAIKNVFGLARD